MKASYIWAFIVLLSVLLTSCSDRQVLRTLDDVDTYISERPDCALAVLDSLSGTDIRGREANARFALLYSMALDKNYIDLTDDSLINVAVGWYRRHGTADERLKAWYYQGRVYENAGDNEKAMESFVRAETCASEAVDDISKGMLYKAMSGRYTRIFDYENGALYNEKAKKCYLSGGDSDKYAGTLIYSSSLYYTSGDLKNAVSSLDSVKAMLMNMTESRRNLYYVHSMRLSKDIGDSGKLSWELNSYLSEFSAEDISWVDVAEYYTFLKQYDSAKVALVKFRKSNPGYKNDPAYYLVSYNLNDSVKDFQSALEDYVNYSLISDSLSLVIAEQDIGFIQERHEKELLIEKEKNTRLLISAISIFSILILLGLIYVFRLKFKKNKEKLKIISERNKAVEERNQIVEDRNRLVEARNKEIEKEKKILEAEISEYKINYSQLERERDELSDMIADNPPVDKLSMKVINDRLNLLNRFFAASIAADSEIDRKACKELERLVTNRDEFLYTTRMTFAAAHPDFVKYLESKGLNDLEIEYCCLYTIGLKGKDISKYIKRACHYNESSDIRAKLGLGKHDTNLGNYLRSLL